MTALIGDDIHARSEAELLCQAQQGSAAAFGVLAQRYRPVLMGVLTRRRLAGLEAEDVVQEALALAYTSIDSYDPGRPFGPWLTTIAYRVAATRRRRRRERPVEIADRPDPSIAPAEAIARQQERENLWALVRKALPPRQYEALQLRYTREMSVREVAETMSISSIHVKVLLYRARRTLLRSEPFRQAFGRTGGSIQDGGKS